MAVEIKKTEVTNHAFHKADIFAVSEGLFPHRKGVEQYTLPADQQNRHPPLSTTHLTGLSSYMAGNPYPM